MDRRKFGRLDFEAEALFEVRDQPQEEQRIHLTPQRLPGLDRVDARCLVGRLLTKEAADFGLDVRSAGESIVHGRTILSISSSEQGVLRKKHRQIAGIVTRTGKRSASKWWESLYAEIDAWVALWFGPAWTFVAAV
jgi:hypothetical protein